MRVGTSMRTSSGGLYAVIGVLAGLLRRERGAARGSGARVDIAMLDSVVSVLENAVARYQATGVEPDRWGRGTRRSRRSRPSAPPTARS